MSPGTPTACHHQPRPARSAAPTGLARTGRWRRPLPSPVASLSAAVCSHCRRPAADARRPASGPAQPGVANLAHACEDSRPVSSDPGQPRIRICCWRGILAALIATSSYARFPRCPVHRYPNPHVRVRGSAPHSRPPLLLLPTRPRRSWPRPRPTPARRKGPERQRLTTASAGCARAQRQGDGEARSVTPRIGRRHAAQLSGADVLARGTAQAAPGIAVRRPGELRRHAHGAVPRVAHSPMEPGTDARLPPTAAAARAGCHTVAPRRGSRRRARSPRARRPHRQAPDGGDPQGWAHVR
jgi:hypothetical protein